MNNKKHRCIILKEGYMDDYRFSQIIELGREQRSIEFKGSGSMDTNRLVMQIIKACIAMANNRDGGMVIIGITDNHENGIALTGLTTHDLQSWQYDRLADKLSEYCDPCFPFSLEKYKYKDQDFILINIEEFIDVPILCKKNYGDLLRAGACYVRTRRKPETTEIPSITDMRDLIDLAITKGLRSFISRAYSSGLPIISTKPGSNAEYLDELSILLGDRK
jgi:predicted HTH transcriptional regulator